MRAREAMGDTHLVYCREVAAGRWEGQAGAQPGATRRQRWNFSSSGQPLLCAEAFYPIG